MSTKAVDQIFKSLITSYEDGSDLAARESMLDASFKAGVAFTRANVGYVHAIAHQFGGMFHTPHGDANAMLLPHVLEFYLSDELQGGSCTNMFCELAVAAGLARAIPADVTATVKLASAFVERIKQMNLVMNIPSEVKSMKASDVAAVAKRALDEAHGMLHNPFSLNLLSWILDLGMPNPKCMTHAECEAIIRKVLPISVVPIPLDEFEGRLKIVGPHYAQIVCAETAAKYAGRDVSLDRKIVSPGAKHMDRVKFTVTADRYGLPQAASATFA